ncbi:hypothetical protein C6P61_17245 [Malikia spinosa]|uniref:Pentapeptide repeat-containing protein n=1 Tax=Malikia spinosa TaxID=86180 RepID=A0A2S9KA38_9BURK|nr:pentapeptide repeat-containing protein [Malikia spinosa]PRD67284.1 hypothetical protein C6P61_17245 [Malikia spinosa]
MSRNKSTKRYSYNNHDSRASKFIHKDFNKTENYLTNFSEVLFQNTSFVGAKLKFCAFYSAVFDNCYIRGALFRRCNLKNAVFKKSIISATFFEGCKLQGCRFENCKIISSSKLEKGLPSESFVETEIFQTYPATTIFSRELIDVVESLRMNDYIRRSSVLHRKEKKLDTVSLKVLVERFGEDLLINNLPFLPKVIAKEFYTLSYIIHFLLKIQSCDINEVPGPAALGAPKLTNDCSSTD